MGIKVIVYEPELSEDFYLDCEVVSDEEDFKHRASLIVANRYSEALKDVASKLYTRDIFGTD
jgi:UDPglucose 6-dehydrogenase